MNVQEKLIASIRNHTPYLNWTREGKTPDEIKDQIIAILRPYFQNPSVLSDFPISVLAHEAVTIGNIQGDPWAALGLRGVLSEYREAMVKNRSESLAAIEAWDGPIARAMSEFMSIYLMEADKADLALYELSLEIFRWVGGLLEACVQPQIKALLHHVRIRRGQQPQMADIARLKFGTVVEELNQTLDFFPSILVPPPWGVKLNQWRNIAQHQTAVVQGDHVLCEYRIGNIARHITLNREELFALAKRIQEVLGILRAARSVFIGDNSAALRDRRIPTPRKEILFFQTAVGISTQGYDVLDVVVSGDTAHLYVQDCSDQDPILRGVRASQFLVATWIHFPKPIIRVTYSDLRGRRRLQVTAAGCNCEEVAKERLPFEAFADRLTLELLDRGAESLGI